MHAITQLLTQNAYPGRGIAVGTSPDGTRAMIAYFIMGRSKNSRNRILASRDGAVFAQAYDESLVEDPSLIHYAALRRLGHITLITNGDQTDTIAQYLAQNKSFEEALRSRCYEPDGPNFTPRISAMVEAGPGLRYRLAILKHSGGTCQRFFYEYEGIPGQGHFLHTYAADGNPLPSFQGEPVCVAMENDQEAWAQALWTSLHGENKIALLTYSIGLSDGISNLRIINKLA